MRSPCVVGVPRLTRELDQDRTAGRRRNRAPTAAAHKECAADPHEDDDRNQGSPGTSARRQVSHWPHLAQGCGGRRPDVHPVDNPGERLERPYPPPVGYRRGTLLCVLLGVVSLAGCSADVSHPSALGSASPAPPAVTISAPASPSPSPATSSAASVTSPSPTISGTPTSAATATASPPISADVIAMHVRATARAYIDDFNIALATGDTTKIEALTSSTCGCRSLVNEIKQMSAKGERYDGVVFTVKSIDVTYLAAGASGDVKYAISAGRILDASGTEVAQNNPEARRRERPLHRQFRWPLDSSAELSVGRERPMRRRLLATSLAGSLAQRSRAARDSPQRSCDRAAGRQRIRGGPPRRCDARGIDARESSGEPPPVGTLASAAMAGPAR